MTTITIEIPCLPPASQSPNSRAHWRKRKADGDVVKHWLRWVIDHDQIIHGIEGRAELEYEFVVAQERRRDGDNWLARAKALTDILVEKGIIPEDESRRLKFCMPCFTVDKARAPMTIIHLCAL